MRCGVIKMRPERPRDASFWNWLLRGIDSGPGFWRLIDQWLLVHVLVGWALALLVPLSLKDAASVILLPLAGVFIGLTFTWIGNAQVILQEERTKEMAKHADDGYFGLAYTFQLIVLVLLIVLSLWAVAGLGVFDQTWPGLNAHLTYKSVEAILYASASLAVRGCWHAVFGSQFLLLAPYAAERKRAALRAAAAEEEEARLRESERLAPPQACDHEAER